MAKRKMSGLASAGFENISPQVIVRVGREIQSLHTSPPEGIKYVPQEEANIAEIYVEIAGPVGTPYEGGAFNVKLVLSNDFPHSPPRGFFLTKIFHPNVGPTGDICVNTLKKDWNTEVTLSHILQVVRCLLIVPFPESSLNDEAGRLFMESYEEYARRARLWTQVHAMRGVAAAAAQSAEGGGAVKAGGMEEAKSSEGGAANVLGNSANHPNKRQVAEKGGKVKAPADKQKDLKKKGLKRL